MIAKVALDVKSYHLDREYDYRIPEEMESALVPGMRVVVPFGRSNRTMQGLVLSVCAQSGQQGLKDIEALLDAAPLLDDAMMRLLFALLRVNYWDLVYKW